MADRYACTRVRKYGNANVDGRHKVCASRKDTESYPVLATLLITADISCLAFPASLVAPRRDSFVSASDVSYCKLGWHSAVVYRLAAFRLRDETVKRKIADRGPSGKFSTRSIRHFPTRCR